MDEYCMVMSSLPLLQLESSALLRGLSTAMSRMLSLAAERAWGRESMAMQDALRPLMEASLCPSGLRSVQQSANGCNSWRSEGLTAPRWRLAQTSQLTPPHTLVA